MFFLKKIVVLFLFICVFSSCHDEKKTINPKKEVAKPVYKYGYNLDTFKVIQDTIENGESFGTILDRHHVLYPKINKIASTIKDVFDARRVRADKTYTILASKDSTEKAQVFIYKHDKINTTVIDFKDSTITAIRHKKPVKIVEKEASGIINSSFSETMDSLSFGPNLTYKIADIYAWTLDFYRLQEGDSFKFIYEEKYIDDSTFVGYGKIKSIVFNHKRKDLYAYRFVADSIKNIPEYYNEKGNMLQRQFLKSPIKFKYRISSKYNLRRRIAYYGYRIKPHRGTDFAARIGTPIIATASGTVTESKRRRGNGNYVKIKHNSTYSTQYLHMKKRKVKKGHYVQQGDVIGWVGMTGNTGGPHVCYRFWKHGKEVDPFKQKFPSSKPLKKELKPKYLEFIAPLKNQLDNINLPQNQLETAEIVAQN